MREMELLTTAQTNAPNLSPNTSKNPLSVTNSDGQDDIGSDETGSNSSAQVRKIGLWNFKHLGTTIRLYTYLNINVLTHTGFFLKM